MRSLLELPGTLVSERDIGEAAQDPRDWFSPEQRLSMHRWLEGRHAKSSESRRRPPFRYTTIMLVGGMGRGKSVLATATLLPLYAGGVPVFHNGSCLFGRALSIESLFLAIDQVPVGSAIFLDEIHTINTRNSELATAQIVQNQAMAGLRKKNVLLLLGTAKPSMVGHTMLDDVEQLWLPEMVRTEARLTPGPSRLPPRDDAANFRYAYRAVREYPFRRDGILEWVGLAAPNQRQRGRWQTRLMDPGLMRMAFMATDSFRPLLLGAGARVDKQAIRSYLTGNPLPAQPSGAARDPQVEQLEEMCGAWWEAFENGTLARKGYVKAGALAKLGGHRVHPAPLGGAITRVLGIEPHGHEGRKGYDLSELYGYLKGCVDRQAGV